MDGTRFDAWTRRRLGIAAGGFAAALIALVSSDEGIARKKRKKKKKKRCLDIGAPCTPGGKKCCHNQRCASAGGGGPNTFCCKTEGDCRFTFDCCFGWSCEDFQCVEIPSDRALKTNFASVDPADILERVRDLPISTWNYTADDPTVRHVGPMAQDFAALFAVGADDRHIHPLDGQGVALAAIKGLLAQIDALQAENTRLAARVAALERPPDGLQ